MQARGIVHGVARGRRRGGAVALACSGSLCLYLALLLLWPPAGASAAPMTIGQLAPEGAEPTCFNKAANFDLVDPTVEEGPSYVVPSDASEITSWSTRAGEGAGQMLTMKVFRQTGTAEGGLPIFTVVGHDGPVALTPSTLNTLPVSIPVQPGDLLGLDDEVHTSGVADACTFATGLANDGGFEGPDLADGASSAFIVGTCCRRDNISAVTVAFPVVTSVEPSSGPGTGGTAVTINGRALTGASAVYFGSTPAARFNVVTNGQITAVSPSEPAGPVDVTVATPEGTSTATAADRFTFLAPSATSHVLSVRRAGSGSGVVKSLPGGIECGAACSALFGAGTTVALTATASPNSIFGGWSGACTGTGTCQVTVSADQSVTAVFNLVGVARLASASGVVSASGVTVTVACPGATSCSGTAEVDATNAHAAGSGGRKHTGILVIARGRYAIPAGKTRKIALRLTPAGRQVARKHARLHATLKITPARGKTTSHAVTLVPSRGNSKK